MSAAAASCSLVSSSNARAQFPAGSRLKPLENLKGLGCTQVSFAPNLAPLRICTSRGLSVQASFSDHDRSGGANAFIGGFVLGGLIVGTLGCVYAPQISRALAGTDKNEIMKKLPKFIYDEDKALERTRNVLAQKIAQLNSAIDDVSTQLRPEETPNGVAGEFKEVEAGA